MSERHSVVLTAGLGCAGAVLLTTLLPQGGLAPLTMASVAAVGIGAPLGALLWQGPPAKGPVGVVLRTTAGLFTLLALGAAGAIAAGHLPGTWGPLGIGLVWVVAAVASRGSGPLVLTALALVASLAAGGIGIGSGRVESALQPSWGMGPWLGWSLGLGALAAGLVGPWASGPARRPGDRHTPFAVAGAAVLTALGLYAWLAGRYGLHLGLAPDPTAGVLMLLATLAGAGCWLAWADWGERRWWMRALGGLATALWLAGPGRGGIEVLLLGLLPLLAGLWLLLRAYTLSGAARGWVGAAAVGMLATLIGAPSLPDAPSDAVALTVLLVVGFWVVATRAVRAQAVA